MKKKIIFIGGGGHAISCYDVIDKSEYEVIGYSDLENKSQLYDLEYLGNDDEIINKFSKKINILITVGQILNSKNRENLYYKFKSAGFTLPTIISKNAVISSYAKIGEGSIIMNNVVVNGKAEIEENCILNTSCIIEHDSFIGKNTHISTSSVINGNCRIGSNCFIGSNSTINHNISIANYTIVPSHSRISKNIDK